MAPRFEAHYIEGIFFVRARIAARTGFFNEFFRSDPSKIGVLRKSKRKPKRHLRCLRLRQVTALGLSFRRVLSRLLLMLLHFHLLLIVVLRQFPRLLAMLLFELRHLLLV